MEKSAIYYGQTRLEMLPFIPKSAKRILDVGCGQGNFSAYLAKEGVEVWGVEVNQQPAKEACKKLFKVITKSLDEALSEIPNDYFDVIIFNDVLEHLLHPWEDLKNIKSKLTKEGVVVSSIPNVRYSKNLFNLLFKKNWKYTEQGILDSTHFRFFTKKSIKALYKENGYTIQKMKGINVTKSFLFFPFAILFNILFLCTQLDMFYMQFATVAKKKY
jgi:2-polyprenyl-3-methyl-5-hydroxy-6-metoxy-1,4-benzoquinol methylase